MRLNGRGVLSRMAIATFLMAIATGCSYITKGVDRASDVFVGQIQEYCENAYHRRLAIYIFITGELEPFGHTISVYCKGDEEPEPESVPVPVP